MSSMGTSTQPGDRMATRQNKQMIVTICTATMVLLLAIDFILLYMLLTYGPRTITKTVTRKASANLIVPSLYQSDDEDSYLLLQEVSPNGLGLRDRRLLQHLCNTSGCLWLKGYLHQRDGASNHIPGQSQQANPATPCSNFYEHVCGNRQRSMYEDAVARLMTAVTPRLLGKSTGAPENKKVVQEILNNDEPEVDDNGVLERCLEGGAMLTQDDIMRACRDVHGEGACPVWMPDAPVRTSEDYFRDNPEASIEDYAAFVHRVSSAGTHINDWKISRHVLPGMRMYYSGCRSERDFFAPHTCFAHGTRKTIVDILAPRLNQKRLARQHKADSSIPFSKPWISRVCRWVALSARCHLERIHLQPRSRRQLASYQQTWEVIYFAPLMGAQARPLVQHAYWSPSQACLRIVEDLSRRATAQAARAVLSEAMEGSLDDTLAHFVWEAGQVMRTFVPKWLAPKAHNATDGDEDDSVERLDDREAASQRLGAIEVRLVDPVMAQDDVSVYSWEVRYTEYRKVLLVSPGLLALLLNTSALIEPVLVPGLGREILRALMPTSRGPYAWRPHNQRRFEVLVDCVASGLDVVSVKKGARELATETTLEIGMLEPLMVLYKRRLLEELGRGVRLHRDYSNAELFFVLWALAHCGERDAEHLVNGAMKNSPLFARAFQCSVNEPMWSGRRCPFWH